MLVVVEVLSDARRRRTLEGQDHGPGADVLVPALKGFFRGIDGAEQGRPQAL